MRFSMLENFPENSYRAVSTPATEQATLLRSMVGEADVLMLTSS